MREGGSGGREGGRVRRDRERRGSGGREGEGRQEERNKLYQVNSRNLTSGQSNISCPTAGMCSIKGHMA